MVLTRDLEAFRAKAPHIATAPEVRFITGDVRTFPFPGGQFTHIIHAATEASLKLNDEQPITMLDTITEGTRRVLDLASQSGTDRFLLTSSGAVYGRQPLDMPEIPESYMGSPNLTDHRSAYGEGKRYAELLCNLYAREHGFTVTSARCFAFVGPHLPINAHFAIGNFLRDGLAGGPIRINGDGTPLRSYLYAADLAAWLWTILVRGENTLAYNVGSDKALSIAEIANKVANSFPNTVQVDIAQAPQEGVLPERYIPSINLARSKLSLDVWTDIDTCVRQTLSWLQDIKL